MDYKIGRKFSVFLAIMGWVLGMIICVSGVVEFSEDFFVNFRPKSMAIDAMIIFLGLVIGVGIHSLSQFIVAVFNIADDVRKIQRNNDVPIAPQIPDDVARRISESIRLK